MKRFTSILALLLLVLHISFAAEYYVSKKGSDKNTGKKSAPFLTIQKAADIMKSGEICYILAGVYPETVTLRNSGTEEAPIILKVATDADDVVITGPDLIPNSKWEKESTNIFKVKVDLTLDHENQVFLGNKTMVVARCPNIGDDLLELKTLFMDAGSMPANIIDNEMPDYDYAGGHGWVHAPKYWYNWTGAILSQGIKHLGIIT